MTHEFFTCKLVKRWFAIAPENRRGEEEIKKPGRTKVNQSPEEVFTQIGRITKALFTCIKDK